MMADITEANVNADTVTSLSMMCRVATHLMGKNSNYKKPTTVKNMF